LKTFRKPFDFFLARKLPGLIIGLMGIYLLLPLRVDAQKPIHSQAIAYQPRPDERFLSAFFRGIRTPAPELILLSEQADVRRSYKVLKAYGFQPGNGQLLWQKTLDSVSVSIWQSAAGKGTVAQSFENAIASGIRNDHVIPLAYQYQVRFSPDGKRLLAYSYDYSRKNLFARIVVFDEQWNLQRQEELPLDNGTVNYGIYLQNQGQIYVLNGTEKGDIRLIEHAPGNQRHLMEVPGGNSPRSQLRLTFTPQEAWVINTVDQPAGIAGLMFTRFSLADHSTSQVQYLPLPASTKADRPNVLAGSRVNNRAEVSLVLERKNVLGSGFEYRTDAVNDPIGWQSRKTMVQLGTQVLLTYDTLGVSLNEKVITRQEKVSDERFYDQLSFVVSPEPGIPELLITEKEFVRFEKVGATYQLNTYTNDLTD
jgi:hypothetical protein